MKLKNILLIVACLAVVSNTQAQLLKKLKKKAEQAAERTVLNKTDEIVSKKTEKTIDDVTQGSNENKNNSSQKENTVEYANPSLAINTEAKKAFYTTDVKVISFDEEKQATITSFFDADAVAMQSNWIDQNTGKPQTSYHDSEGYFIAYNETEKRYNKTGLLAMEGMSMITPSMMASAYKLPQGVIWEAMEKMKNNGLKVYPFMHVDFPFVLKPEHFRASEVAGQYKESTQSCRGNSGCTKFSVVETGYQGSYILFDAGGRLVEINIVIENDPNFGSGKGKIEYFYEACSVNVPDAVEKKMPGQDLFKKGLETNKN